MSFSRWKIRSVAIGSVLMLSLVAGLGLSYSASPGSVPPALIKTNVLTVGSDTTYPPMESKDIGTGKYVGADVDLANALAKAAGIKGGAEIVSGTFDNLILALNAKRYDVVMSSMNDTPARAKRVSFIDYMTASMGILVNANSTVHADAYSGLCGHSVAVEKGTVELDGLNAASKACAKKIDILSFPDDAGAFNAFNSGHSDAYTSDLPVVINYLHDKRYKGHFKVAGKAISAGANYGIALRKSDSALKSSLTKALATIRQDGTYMKILTKWKVQDAALKK